MIQEITTQLVKHDLQCAGLEPVLTDDDMRTISYLNDSLTTERVANTVRIIVDDHKVAKCIADLENYECIHDYEAILKKDIISQLKHHNFDWTLSFEVTHSSPIWDVVRKNKLFYGGF